RRDGGRREPERHRQEFGDCEKNERAAAAHKSWRIRFAIAGMSVTSSAMPRVKITITYFLPLGSSTYAASCRTSLVHPAFDHSFVAGGSDSPMNSFTWFSSLFIGSSG